MRGDILAIYYEDEVPIHSRGGQKHNHELFPHTFEHFCVHCALQRKYKLLLGLPSTLNLFYFIPNLALLSALTILLLRVQLSIPPCSNYGSNAAIPASLRWISAHHQSPLLIIFLLTVLKVNAFPMTIMFGMCSIFLFMASILQRRLMVIAESHKSSKFFVLDSSPEKI